jgi:hypothetical protein
MLAIVAMAAASNGVGALSKSGELISAAAAPFEAIRRTWTHLQQMGPKTALRIPTPQIQPIFACQN